MQYCLAEHLFVEAMRESSNKVVLTFESVDEILSLTTQMKATEQYILANRCDSPRINKL